jgi:decaprenyl-phosphate phosphoribosyltransferase
LSQWFLLVLAFGSLFQAAGKRYAELQLAERTGASIRKSLENYTSTYLRFVWTLSATAVVVCYGLWAFERDHGKAGWFAVSMVPWTIAILRYAVDVDGGVAGEPEEIALRDRVLQLRRLPRLTRPVRPQPRPCAGRPSGRLAKRRSRTTSPSGPASG